MNHPRTIMAIVLPRWRAECARKLVRQQDERAGHVCHALRASERTPLLVISSERGARIVCGCCVQAQRHGVQIGMDLAHARAICPPPRIEVDAQPEREAALLRAVARWCQRYAPITAIEPTEGPTAILVDITGCEGIYHSHTQLTQRVVRELAARGFAARVALAPTTAAAVARAQSRASTPLLECALRTLRISPQAIAALAEVNVQTIGELARLPRVSVASRYGRDVLQRLDLSLVGSLEGTGAERCEILIPIRSQPPPSVEHIFDGPVTNHEGIALTVARLLQELCATLKERVRGGREFELTACCADAPTYHRRIMLGSPSARAAHLFKLFAPHLEKIPMGMGVESLRIAVLRMGAWSAQSEHAAGSSCGVGEWADTLMAQLGDRALFRGGFAEHHEPLRSFRWIPIARCGLTARVALRHAHTRAASAWRPSTWCSPPEPIVVAAAHAPSIRWRGTVVEIARWLGPERIASPWNDADLSATSVATSATTSVAASADYWRVETAQGAWLWIAHSSRVWSLVGIWS